VRRGESNEFANMQRAFVLLCFLIVSKYANATESSQNCRNNKGINVTKGEELTLISPVDPLMRCYFVFTDDDSGEQCCFSKEGSNEDCESSGKYKPRNNAKCPEHVLIVDSIETGTCILKIKSVSEAAAGEYKSYDADHKRIEGCQVTVSGGISNGGGTGAIVGSLVAVVLAVVLLGIVMFFLWKKRGLPQNENQDKECGGQQDQGPLLKLLPTPQPEFENDGRTFKNCLGLHYLLLTGKEDEVLRKKLELSSSILSHTIQYEEDSETTKGVTALHLAAGFGSAKTVKVLLEAGADIHARDENKRTPLHYAAHNRVDVVKMLIDHGADVKAADRQQQTALNLAEKRRKVDVVKLLIDKDG